VLLVGAIPCADGRLPLFVETLTGFDLVVFSRSAPPRVSRSFQKDEWGFSLAAFAEAMAAVEPGAVFLGEPYEADGRDFAALSRLVRSLGLPVA